MFRLDRNAFNKRTFDDADNHSKEKEKLSVNENLKISFYLNSIAYQFDINYPPKMDKTVFEIRKRNE
jgi:hypothetical protein